MMTNKKKFIQYEQSKVKRNKRAIENNCKLFGFKSVYLFSNLLIYISIDSSGSEEESRQEEQHRPKQKKVPILVDVVQENEEKDRRIGMFIYI